MSQINIVLFSLLISYLSGFLPSALFGSMIVSEHSLFSGLSDSQSTFLFGMIMAAYGLGQLIGSPILGATSDRLGRRFILLCSLFLSACGNLTIIAAICSSDIYSFVLGRFILGFSDGNVAVLTSIASNLTDDKKLKEKYLSLTNVIGNVGWLIGPIVGSLLVDVTLFANYNYITAFIFSLLLITINLGFVYWGITKDLPNQQEKIERIQIATLKPQIALITCIHFSLFLIFVYMPYYYVKRFDLSPLNISICIGFISVVMIAAGMLHSRFAEDYQQLFSTPLGFILSITSLCLVSYSSSIYFTLFFLGIFAVGATIGATILECNTIIIFSYLSTDENQGKIMGLYRSVAVSMGVLSSISIGLLSSISLIIPFMLSIASGTIGFLIYLTYKNRILSKSPYKYA